jgi:hypothetical protein
MYSIVATLPDMFTSLVATKISRIRRFLLKKKTPKNKKKKLLQLANRVAILSFIINNDYVVDRLFALANSKCVNRVINSMIRSRVLKLSDDKWFVYRHACLQAKWLDLRGKPRDKLRSYRLTAERASMLGRTVDSQFVGMYRGIHHVFSNSGLYLV